MAVSGVNIAAYLHCTCSYTLCWFLDNLVCRLLKIRGLTQDQIFCGTLALNLRLQYIMPYICSFQFMYATCYKAIHEIINYYSCLLNPI